MRNGFLTTAAMALLLASPAIAQPAPGMPMHHMAMDAPIPSQPGQGAFGAIQEIIAILRADPNTDWSKVNIDALRAHLIDMDEVTLHADAVVRHIDGGIEVAVTGQGRTLEAIRRMVPKDAEHLNGMDGWSTRTAELPNGVTLYATSTDPKQAAIIQGLGFAGVLASGPHHQMHHLMIAKGQAF